MKATWRCLLPPLSEFAEAAPLHCLRLDARGAVQERIEASLAELARRRQGLPVALFLQADIIVKAVMIGLATLALVAPFLFRGLARFRQDED